MRASACHAADAKQTHSCLNYTWHESVVGGRLESHIPPWVSRRLYRNRADPAYLQATSLLKLTASIPEDGAVEDEEVMCTALAVSSPDCTQTAPSAMSTMVNHVCDVCEPSRPGLVVRFLGVAYGLVGMTNGC